MAEAKLTVTVVIMDILEVRVEAVTQPTKTDLSIEDSTMSLTEDVVVKVNTSEEMLQVSDIRYVPFAVSQDIMNHIIMLLCTTFKIQTPY